MLTQHLNMDADVCWTGSSTSLCNVYVSLKCLLNILQLSTMEIQKKHEFLRAVYFNKLHYCCVPNYPGLNLQLFF